MPRRRSPQIPAPRAVGRGPGAAADPRRMAPATIGGAVTDHASLTGLTADDHAQYAKADGTRGTFEVAGAVAAHTAAPDPHPGYQLESEKGAANGYASLGASARVPVAQIGSGTPDGTKFLRDDGTFAVPVAGIWTAVTKPSNQTKTSNTTFANDDALVVAVTSGVRYLFRAVVFFDSAATPDIKFQWTGPATTMQSLHIRAVVGGGAAYANISVDKALATADALAGTGASGAYLMDGIIQFSASGTFALQWAQNTSDPAATTVLRGSYLEWRAI